MTRAIAAPPPTVITQLSELVTLVLNAKESAQVIDNLKAASDEYQTARLDYEAAISRSVIAQQEAQAKLDEAQPMIEQAVAEKLEAQRYLQELAESRAQLQSGYVNLESRQAEHDATVKAERAALDAQKIELDKLVEKARTAAEEATALRDTLARKLALLQEA